MKLDAESLKFQSFEPQASGCRLQAASPLKLQAKPQASSFQLQTSRFFKLYASSWKLLRASNFQLQDASNIIICKAICFASFHRIAMLPEADSLKLSSFKFEGSSFKPQGFESQASNFKFLLRLQPSSFRLQVLLASRPKSQASSFKLQACSLQAVSFKLPASSFITSIDNNLNINIKLIIACFYTRLRLQASGWAPSVRLQASGCKLQAASTSNFYFQLQELQTSSFKLPVIVL